MKVSNRSKMAFPVAPKRLQALLTQKPYDVTVKGADLDYAIKLAESLGAMVFAMKPDKDHPSVYELRLVWVEKTGGGVGNGTGPASVGSG